MRKRRLAGAVAVAAALAAAPVGAEATHMISRHHGGVSSRPPQGARRGRPRKFDRPSRAVTLTLPIDTLAALRAIDADISRAVVRAVEPIAADLPATAELASFGDHAVILVPPVARLRERIGVDLVPLSAGRSLISFDEQLPISEIELRLRDELADPNVDPAERTVLEAVARILRTARRDGKTALAKRSIIVLHKPNADANQAADDRPARAEAV